VSQPENREKYTKTPYFKGLRSFKVIDVLTPLRSFLPVLVMMRSISVLICNHFHAKPANSGKMMFLGDAPYPLLFKGTLVTQQHELLSRNTRDSKLSYDEKLKSLSHLVLYRYQVVTHRTDKRTDRRTPRQNYHI